jgi:hypothetical protein
MTASDDERYRIQKLRAILRENHVTPEDARKEDRSGPEAARREEWARRPCWKIKRSRERGISVQGEST